MIWHRFSHDNFAVGEKWSGRNRTPALSLFSNVLALGRDEADFAQPGALIGRVRGIMPTIIVNAAYTAVDKAETEEALAYTVIAEAPGALAREAVRLNALLIHYSTNYVFDGEKEGVYVEDDVTHPPSAYGRTKLAGEIAITKSGCRHLIFRTSRVFSPHSGNFVKTMQRLVRECTELRVVSDQIGAPTAAHITADVTAYCLNKMNSGKLDHGLYSGIYRLASQGETTWCGLATAVVERARRSLHADRIVACHFEPILTESYPLPATRPKKSRLDCTKLRSRFGLHIPSWQTSLDYVGKTLF